VQDTDAANLGQVREIAGDSGVRLDNTLRVGFGNIVRAGSQPVVLWTEAPTSRADVTAQGGSGTKYDSDANKVEFYANNY
ncbi:hypothetical protein, partial [Paraburkholderia sp. SIMBA_054]|uniref:hypothetical protein n=1 Tax=Paraburkholderia sp. SIMBA_054 TaxID=3085795 RepID=UPI0039782AD4